MFQCGVTDRYYHSEEFKANVLVVKRDHAAERLAVAGERPSGECDAEIAMRALETYLCAKHNGFRTQPEFRRGVELRCETLEEARHMVKVMTQITQETIPYHVTWR